MMKLILLLCFACWVGSESRYAGDLHHDVIVKMFQKQNAFQKDLAGSGWAGLDDDEQCAVCKVLASLFEQLVAEKRSKEEMERIVSAYCVLAKLHSERICKLFTKEYMDMALGVVELLILKPEEVCGLYLGPSCATPYDPMEMWNVTLPNTPKPPVVPPKPPAPSAPKMRFLQLTDIHIDLMYQAGRDAECEDPLCCRTIDGFPAPGVPGAGKWGDYRGCDLPTSLVDNLFQHLATKKQQFDFIIFTGDISAHDDYNQSRSDQIGALENLVPYFDKYLPDIPVYFCVGNHDTAPEGSCPPPFITGKHSQAWMYEAQVKNWGKWLPAQTKETIMRGGFYTFSPFPGFRIISVNSVYCYNSNWWVLINSTDPAGELQWLAETLQEAEDKGEKAFILTHIPTDCLKAWSWNYYKIVSRYESTIVGQFNGHTHNDEFRMYYDVANLTRPVGVAYVSGSVSPMGNKNPVYRIYTMDGNYPNSSFQVLGFENYIFDLGKYNNGSGSSWELLYNPVVDYGMKGVTPADWSSLVYRMKDDEELMNNFYRHYHSGFNSGTCTGKCKDNLLCTLNRARTGDPDLCRNL